GMGSKIIFYCDPVSLFSAGPTHNQYYLGCACKPVLKIVLIADEIEALCRLTRPGAFSSFALYLKDQVGHPTRLVVPDFQMSVDANLWNYRGIPPVAHILNTSFDQIDTLLTEQRLCAKNF